MSATEDEIRALDRETGAEMDREAERLDQLNRARLRALKPYDTFPLSRVELYPSEEATENVAEFDRAVDAIAEAEPKLGHALVANGEVLAVAELVAPGRWGWSVTRDGAARLVRETQHEVSLRVRL